MDIVVWPRGPHDWPAVKRTSDRAWQVGYRGIVPDEFLDSLGAEPPPETARPPSGRPPGNRFGSQVASYVAEIEGQVVAGAVFCAARGDDLDPQTTGELAILNVDPDWWRRGVGRALMSRFDEWLAANDFTHAVLWVLRDNARGRAFYEALGWAPDGAERKETLTPYGLPEVRYSK